MEDAIKEQLQRFLPIRAVIRQYPDGGVEGLIEHSFAMDWSKYNIRLFWSGKAYSMLGEHQIDGIEDANYNCKFTEGDLVTPKEDVIDPLAIDCPIQIDWVKWLAALAAKDKFSSRNAIFTIKEKVA